jgi:hypothetical protein
MWHCIVWSTDSIAKQTISKYESSSCSGGGGGGGKACEV